MKRQMQNELFRHFEDDFVFIITGGTGYIGHHLIEALSDNNLPVISLQRSDRNVGSKNNVEVISLKDSFENKLVQIKRYSRDSKIILIHLAALYIKDHEPADIDRLVISNVSLTAQIAELAKNINTHAFINVGTNWEFDDAGTIKPPNLYAATKTAAVSIMNYYRQFYPVQDLKMYDTFGRTDNRQKLLPYLKNSLQNSSDVELTDVGQRLHLVYIDDVIHNLLKISKDVCERGIENNNLSKRHPFFLTADMQVGLKELIELIKVETSCEIPVTWKAKTNNETEVKRPYQPSENTSLEYPVGLRMGLRRYFGDHDAQ